MTRRTAKKSRPRGGSTPARSNRLPGLKLWDQLTLSDESDEFGRLLLEDSAPQRAREMADRAGVPSKTVVCAYSDTPSRLDGLMNESAYEAMRSDTGDVLDGFAWLTRSYLGLPGSRAACVQCLFDVSHLGLSLPLVLFGRAERPIPRKGRLPSYVASLFKASRGVYSAAVDMVNKKGAEAEVSAVDITAFADQEGHFRRPVTGRVCAAPTRLIQRTLAVMLTGEGGDPSRSTLSALVDFEVLWKFYSVEKDLNETLSSYGFLLQKLTESGASADPEELFVRMVPDKEGLRPFGDVTEQTLRRANEAQTRLNELLGRSVQARRVTFEDLLRLI